MTLNNKSFVIGDWLVKPTNNLLINSDDKKRVEPKVMALLVCLANANGKVLSRDYLLDNIWDQVVLGDALTNTIAQLRKALGDSSSPKKYIETIPKHGYRLIPKVEWQGTDATQHDHNSEPGEDLITHSSPQSSTSSTFKERRAVNQNDSKKLALKILAFCFILIFVAFIIYLLDLFPKPTKDIPLDNKTTTVAVLPFDVYSSQEDIKHFADGLTEELIHQLAADPDLQVIARTSSSKFQGTKAGIKEISNILNARFIIEGSIRQNGNNLRTTVQLIDAHKGFHLWSKTFDNNIDGLFLDTQIAIGEKVSSLITNKDARDKNHVKRNHPRSAEAYKYFILAQSHMKNGSVASYQKAIDYYQKSTVISPEYALAYTGIAAAKLLLTQYNHTSSRQAQLEANKLLNKALEIEPQLADAYAVRGLLYTYAREYQSAEKNYLKAIQLNPSLRFARHNYGYMLSLVFRTKEAIEQHRMSLELDPLSPRTHFGIADSLIQVGEIEEGIKQFKSCQEIIPHFSGCFLGLSTVYGLLADKENYLYFLQQSEKRSSSNTFWQLSTRAKYELQIGNLKQTRFLLDKASSKNNFSYHLLKTDLHLQLLSDQLKTFKQKLVKLSLEYPNTSQAHFLLGQTAYFLSDCKLSIVQYETAMKKSPHAFLAIWDWAEGISHQLNLAYCYKQFNNSELALTLIQEYREFIEYLPESNIIIPGKIYNQARYYALIDETDNARIELEKIVDWPFLWLAKKDPILKTLH